MAQQYNQGLRQKIYKMVESYGYAHSRIYKKYNMYKIWIYDKTGAPLCRIASSDLNSMHEEIKYFLEVGYD